MRKPNGLTSLVCDELPTNYADQAYAWLREFNQAANPELWANYDDPQPLQIALLNSDREIVGGLFAATRMSWLKISIMAVAPTTRRQGIGRALLNMAEEEAVKRGCCHSYVDTMEYQSPAFYQKCGYHEAGTIANWDSHGHTKYFLIKQLAPGVID